MKAKYWILFWEIKGLFNVAITSLGCKVNQCDGAWIGRGICSLGGRLVSAETPADLHIINTCSVTQKSDYQCRQLIRRVHRSNPQAAIVVTGCYASRAPQELARLPGVCLVVGNEDKESLPAMLAANFWAHKRGPEVFPEGECLKPEVFPNPAGHTRAFIKIQDGCNAGCSYCVVPAVRGRSRSLNLAEVKRLIEQAGARGYQEVVLTGIHLGGYGADLTPPADLPSLLAWADRERPVARIRLSSLEPTDILEDILTFMTKGGILCPHLHIPLQSGDDRILAAMRRPYDAAFFRRRLEELFSLLPDLAVGLDVIAGFPGEDEEAFRRTVEMIQELPLAYLHVFPYSRRPGTPAAALAGQVAEKVKKERALFLRTLGEEKKQQYAGKFIGRKLSLLVCDINTKGGGAAGITENYLPFTLSDPHLRPVNSLIEVVPESYRQGRLYGRAL